MSFVGRPDPVDRRSRNIELFAADDDVAMEEFMPPPFGWRRIRHSSTTARAQKEPDDKA